MMTTVSSTTATNNNYNNNPNKTKQIEEKKEEQEEQLKLERKIAIATEGLLDYIVKRLRKIRIRHNIETICDYIIALNVEINPNITTTTSTTAATKSATETLSRPTLPRTQVKTSTSIIERRTESPTTDLASDLTPLIIDNKSSSPTLNQALKTKREEAEAIEHATITTTKESIEPLPQQQTIRQENLIRSKENTNNYLRNDNLDPLAANMTSWQYSTVAWIDMYKEFAINAAKLSEYWFNLFWSPWTVEQRKDKVKVE
jgi:hypothetical protein